MKSVEDKDERECLYERASQYGDENIKIVRLQKTADPLVCLSANLVHRAHSFFLDVSSDFTTQCYA